MAGFLVFPDAVVQAVLRGEIYAQETRNVLYFRFRDVNPAPLPVEVSVLHDSLVANLLTTLNAAQTTEFTISAIDYRLLNPLSQATYQGGTTYAGGLVSESLPPSVTANTKRSVGFIGRINRQRNYWAGVAEIHHSLGRLTAAGLLVWGAVAGRLVTDFPTPVVGQYFENVLTGIAPGGGPTTVRDLIVGVVDPILRSQRRREIGVGM